MCRRDISIHSPPCGWEEGCASEETAKPLPRLLRPHCGAAGEDPSVRRVAAARAPAGLGTLLGAVPCRGCRSWACWGVRMAPRAHRLSRLPVVGGLTSSASPPQHQTTPKHQPPLRRCRAKHHPQSASPTNTPILCSPICGGKCQLQRPVAGQPFAPHWDAHPGAASLRSTPAIKSLISKAGKGGFIPSGLERQMGTQSSDLSWAEWGRGLGRLGGAATTKCTARQEGHWGCVTERGFFNDLLFHKKQSPEQRTLSQQNELQSFASEMFFLSFCFPGAWGEQTHCSSCCHAAAEPRRASARRQGEGFVLGAD